MFQKDIGYYELTVRIIFELNVFASSVMHSQHNKISLNMIGLAEKGLFNDVMFQKYIGHYN